MYRRVSTSLGRIRNSIIYSTWPAIRFAGHVLVGINMDKLPKITDAMEDICCKRRERPPLRWRNCKYGTQKHEYLPGKEGPVST